MTRINLLPSIIILSAIILVAVGVTVFSTIDLARGPELSNISPANGTVLTDPLITVEGRVDRINRLYFNDRQIFADPDQKFSESLLLLPGYNILTIRAQDQFEREVKKKLNLIYQPS